MAMPVHAEVRAPAATESDAWSSHQLPALEEPQAAASGEQNHALTGETRIALPHVESLPSAQAPAHGQLAANDHSAAAVHDTLPQQPSELLHATGALTSPHVSDAQPFAHGASAVSAEMLQGAMAGIVQHAVESGPNQAGAGGGTATHLGGAELGEVLADALGGGSHAHPDIDALLDAVGKGADPHQQVSHVLAATGALGHEAFAVAHADMHAMMALSDAMVVHQLATTAA
jgi:hypothetical protein